MVTYYKTVEGRINEIDAPENGCWINMIDPTKEELEYISSNFLVDQDFIVAALDDEETSRIEFEENQTLMVIDIPIADKENDNMIYYTLPLGFIITENHIVTVCLKENTIIKEFSADLIKNVYTNLKTRFVLQVFYKVAARFLQYLKQINKMSGAIESRLHVSMKNKELIQLLDLEKSLVYFSTSLKSNQVTMKKVTRGNFLRLYEEDKDLLEDVLIEIDQAIEMCNIYSSILSGTMDAFASIISNNLNIVMKRLSSITIVMAVPTIVASIYGMNIRNGIPLDHFWWFPIILSAVAVVLVSFILKKKDMF